MKRKLVMALIGSAITLQAVSAGAIDTEALKENGCTVEYGCVIDIPTVALDASYRLETAPDKTAKMSVGALVNVYGQDLDLKLDDILIVNPENIYVNVREGVDTVIDVAGTDPGIDPMLRMIGINEDWVAFPVPEFDKLGIDFGELSAVQMPEISEEMLNDLMPVAEVFAPEVKDGVTTISINRDKILEAAEKMDEFLAAHKDEIMNYTEISNANPDVIKNLNLNAPFEKYINAFGAGMAKATGMDENEAIEQINQMISQMTEEIIASYNVDLTVEGETVTEEMLENGLFYDAVNESLGDGVYEASLTYDDNSAELILNSDGQIAVVDAAIQEDNTIKLEFGNGEEVEGIGIVTPTEKGFEVALSEAETGEQVRNIIVEAADGELKVELEAPEFTMGFLAEGTADEVSAKGSLAFTYKSGEEEGSLSCYGTLEIPSAPITIELPVASDGLDVVKNIAEIIFQKNTQEETEE